MRDGQPLTLKLQAASEGVPSSPNVTIPQNAANMPGNFTPSIPMPGAGSANGSPSVRPLIRIRRPVIHVPQRVQQEEQGTPPPGQPAPPPPPAQ